MHGCLQYEHCASEPEPFFYGSAGASALLNVCGLAMAVLCLVASPAYSAVSRVDSIGLTVNDLDREVRFFTQVLPFEKTSPTRVEGKPADDLLGMPDAGLKVAELRLGDERITLTEHAAKGRPIPPDSRSYDHWFQHIAIVVRDMDQAYEHLRRRRVRYVSTAPQTLPAWNKAAAGIKAFYFCDPEQHVLEIIWFPPGKGEPKWQHPTDKLFLGIDHTAIVVSDTEASLAFYRDALGLRVVSESENYGVEQEHLNQVFGARVRITSLRAARGPGIEFLEYLTPPGGRDLPEDARANDLVFWRTDLVVDELAQLLPKLRRTGAKPVSTVVVDLSGAAAEPSRGFIVRDPDGHALELEQRAQTTASARR